MSFKIEAHLRFLLGNDGLASTAQPQLVITSIIYLFSRSHICPELIQALPDGKCLFNLSNV